MSEPAFSRRDGSRVELRGECPRYVVDVLDAVSCANDRTRTDLVNEILGEWADRKIHESTLINRVAGNNPT